jgi:pimeloyl-ACP methyl ester carboxylesterase
MLELAADPAFGRGEVEPEAEYYRIHFGTTLTNPEQLNTLVGRLRRAFTPEAVVAARAIETSLYAQTWDREEYDLTPRLAALPMPALVIHGARDFCPPEIAEGIAAAIPRSRLVVLEDCGHFASMEQPVAVRSLVLDFLDQWREP